MRGRLWTEEELGLMKDHMWDDITSQQLQEQYFPTRTVGSVATMRIDCRSGKDRLSKMVGRTKSYWTSKECDIIMKCGPIMSVEQIHDEYLPNRSIKAISSKKFSLGVCSGRLLFVTNEPDRYTKDLSDLEIRTMVEDMLAGTVFRKNSWSADELFYLVKYYDTMSSKELHDKYLKARSPLSIRLKAGRINISGSSTRWTDDLDQLIIDKYNAGFTTQEIADSLSVTWRSIEARIHKLLSGDKKPQLSSKRTRYTPEEDSILLYTARFLSFDKISESIITSKSVKSLHRRYTRLTSAV